MNNIDLQSLREKMLESSAYFEPLPNWVAVKYAGELTVPERALADVFIRAVKLVLRIKPPQSAIIHCQSTRSGLGLRFSAVPSLNEPEQNFLQDLANGIRELHKLRGKIALPSRDVEDGNIEALPECLSSDGKKGYESQVTEGRNDKNTSVEVFKPRVKVEDFRKHLKARDDESRRRISDTLARLAESGFTRQLRLPDFGWEQKFERLLKTFSNFNEVLRYAIYPHLVLLSKGYAHTLRPILFVGEPGIGKTMFAKELALLLNLPPPLFVGYANETNGSALGGSSTFWSNSAPGTLFETLAWGNSGHPAVANPLAYWMKSIKSLASHITHSEHFTACSRTAQTKIISISLCRIS